MALLRFLAVISVALACLSTPAVASAQPLVVPESRIESTRGMALGTGVRASAAGTHALADNPANLVRGGLYHLEAFTQYDPTYKHTSLGSAVTDSMTSKLAAGFALRGLVGKNDAGRHKGFDGRLGLAYPIIEALSVGLAFRYADIHVPNPDAVDDNPDPDIDDHRYRLKHFTMDAAVSISADALTIAAIGSNLVQTDSPLAPRMAGGSVSYGVSDALNLGGDVMVDFDSYDNPKIFGGGGLEFFAGASFPLRGGYQYDQGRNRHSVTAGVGYVDQIIGIHASLRQAIGNVKETDLMFAFQYFVK